MHNLKEGLIKKHFGSNPPTWVLNAATDLLSDFANLSNKNICDILFDKKEDNLSEINKFGDFKLFVDSIEFTIYKKDAQGLFLLELKDNSLDDYFISTMLNEQEIKLLVYFLLTQDLKK